MRNAHPDIVVALFTDHLMGNAGFDGDVIGYLVPHAEERRLRFVAWGPDIRPGVVDRPGTHFDVMPTLMDFLGLSAWAEHYLWRKPVALRQPVVQPRQPALPARGA